MTIQGILSAFCVAAAGVLFDRILGAEHPSALVAGLQTSAHIFVLAAGAGLLLAAFFFYLQRSELAWLHGQISFAVTCDMQNISLPDDTNRVPDALAIANSWSLWNRYKFGLSFIYVSAVEAVLALAVADTLQGTPLSHGRTIAGSLFLLAVIVDAILARIYRARDEANAVALKKQNLKRERGVGSKSSSKPKTL
jgi:hypothetical protein